MGPVVDALAGGALPRLRILNLDCNDIGDGFCAALAASPSRMLQVRRAQSNGGKIAIAEHGAHPRRVAPPPPRAPMNLCAWDPYS